MSKSLAALVVILAGFAMAAYVVVFVQLEWTPPTHVDAALVQETCKRLEQGNVQSAGFILAEVERQLYGYPTPGEKETFRAALRDECPTTLIAVAQGLAERDTQSAP